MVIRASPATCTDAKNAEAFCSRSVHYADPDSIWKILSPRKDLMKECKTQDERLSTLRGVFDIELKSEQRSNMPADGQLDQYYWNLGLVSGDLDADANIQSP